MRQQELHVPDVRGLPVRGDVAERAPPERLAHAPEVGKREAGPAVLGAQGEVPEPLGLGFGAGLTEPGPERRVIVRPEVLLQGEALGFDKPADAVEESVEIRGGSHGGGRSGLQVPGVPTSWPPSIRNRAPVTNAEASEAR